MYCMHTLICTLIKMKERKASLLETFEIDKVAEVTNKSTAIILSYNTLQFQFRYSSKWSARRKYTHKTHWDCPQSEQRTYVMLGGKKNYQAASNSADQTAWL